MIDPELDSQLTRTAVILEIGGFRPTEDPLGSWFGRVLVGGPGEPWPVSNGRPMLPLCQVNLASLPFRPRRTEDIEFLTVFVDSEELPSDQPNGNGWLIRTYRSLDGLVPLEQAHSGSRVKALPMRPGGPRKDYPCHDDIPVELPAEIEEKYYDLCENLSGFKLGGWPSLIQSEIFWAPHNRHPAAPEFVFQIDSTDKGNWSWGDGGVGYFGRGTAPGQEDVWAMEWQCF